MHGSKLKSNEAVTGERVAIKELRMRAASVCSYKLLVQLRTLAAKSVIT